MYRPTLLPWILAIALTGAGCVPSPIAPTGGKKPPRASDVANKPEPTATTTPMADSVTPVADPAKAYRGTVLGLDGLPAANVTVRGHLISNNGGGIISANGGSIISANGGSYRVLSETALEVQTDAEGRFTIQHPDNQPLNLEAVAGPELKAIRFNVAADATDVTLQLAPTGTISGKVTAPEAPGVTDFQGVDVYIPGTGYLAKTNASGAYSIPNVPVGSFTLAAEKVGLGSGVLTEVAVESKTTTTAPNLALKVQLPEIASVTPPHAAPGTELTLTGKHFGHTSGAVLEVSIGGALTAAPMRVDDQTIKVKVPDNAGGDGIVVKVSQIASAVKPFQVLESMTIAPDTRYLIVGAEQRFTVSLKDTNGQAIESPLVTWTSRGVAATVTDGLVKADAVGTAEIEVVAGPKLKKIRTVNVVASAAALPGNEDLTETYDLTTGPGGVFVLGLENIFKINPADGTTTPHLGPRATGAPALPELDSANGMVVDIAGVHYLAVGQQILKIAGDRTVTPHATGFEYIECMTIGPDWTIYVIDSGSLREVSPTGTVTTLASNLEDMWYDQIAVGADGTVYLSDFSWIYKVTEGGQEPFKDDAGNPLDFGGVERLMVGPDGALYFGEQNMSGTLVTIRRLDPETGVVSTPTLSPQVSLNYLGGLAFDADGKLLVIDGEKGKFYRLTLE